MRGANSAGEPPACLHRYPSFGDAEVEGRGSSWVMIRALRLREPQRRGEPVGTVDGL